MSLPNAIRAFVGFATLTLVAGFAQAQSPIVRGFTPRSGPPGTLVKIIGEHLDGATHVDFGGSPADFRVVGGTQLKAIVPAAATSGPIRVFRDGDGSATSVPFVIVVDIVTPPFALALPQPNPSTAQVAWSFTLPAEDRIRLRVFDLRGATVRSLAEGTYGPGVHAGSWDGADTHGRRVGPGLYWLRLEGSGGTVIRNLVRVRR